MPEFLNLEYWNSLARGHMTEIIMILTAAIVALGDRYLRRIVNKLTSSYHKVVRFVVFLLAVSVGYASLALGVATLLKRGFTVYGGLYTAPAILTVLFLLAFEAQRQKQV